MIPHPYQNAFDTAINELNDIATEFEKLRARKNQIENLVEALQPFFAAEVAGNQGLAIVDTANQPIQQENAIADAEPPEGYSFRDVPNPLPDLEETGGDPFQRRGKPGFRFRGLATQRSF
jgi:hypothetical protein